LNPSRDQVVQGASSAAILIACKASGSSSDGTQRDTLPLMARKARDAACVGKGTRGRGGGFGGERTQKNVPTQLILAGVLADSNTEIGGMNAMIYVPNGKS
jgi:hypothetical protein